MPLRAAAALPADAWGLIDQSVETRHKWSLLGLCKNARDAVLENCAFEPSGRRRFNAKQAQAWARVVLLGQNLFMTGGAGVGKTYTLRRIASSILERVNSVDQVALAAPTGAAARVASMAALRANTLHFVFNIRSRERPIGSHSYSVEQGVAGTVEDESEETLQLATQMDDDDDDDDKLPTAILDAPTRLRLRQLRAIIIDECSMVSRDMLELVDSALKAARSCPKPFGGCLCIVVGDFYQLAPVVKKQTAISSWAFDSPIWPVFKRVQLDEVVRQADAQFSGVLNRIRVGACTQSDASWLRANTRLSGDMPLSMFPSNPKCRGRNEEMLKGVPGTTTKIMPIKFCTELLSEKPWQTRRLEEEEVPGNARYKGTSYKGSDEWVALKVGCRVRCTKNIYTGKYPNRELKVANGQLGTVRSIRVHEGPLTATLYSIDDSTNVVVRWDAIGDAEPEETTVWRATWVKRQRFKTACGNPVLAVTKQLPLALAFAITLHTAQGSSILSEVDVDHEGREPVDEKNKQGPWKAKPGSAYVALSRATRVENIRLLVRFLPKHAVADPAVVAYYRRAFG